MQLAQVVGETHAAAQVGNDPKVTLEYDGVKITILGTAHVSGKSADTVREMILSDEYDAVALELCPNRYQALLDPDAISKMDLVQVIRGGRGPMVIASLALGAFQQRVADQLGIEPGADMRAAISAADRQNLPVFLIDRDIGTTLKRIYRNVPWWRRIGVLSGLVASVIARRTVTEEEVEQLKDGDVLESTFNQFAEHSQEIYQPLVQERDQYMVAKLMQQAKIAGHRHILAVVGAGHLRGMKRYFDQQDESYLQAPDDKLKQLDEVPAASSVIKTLPWLIVAIILLGFGIGFYQSADVGWQMVQQWVFINGTLAAIGAIIAFAHPLTVLSAFVAAPLTSLNPTISAGVVSAAVETMMRKPSVGDFSRLRFDTSHVRGWWSNRVAHTLLVFLFTGMGSVIGTYVAGYKIFESISTI